ncbi:MAG: hypothetical protein QQN41_04875 [Nitrosopumilus sp.]
MTKSSKGKEFMESFKDKDNQKIYDLVIRNKDEPFNVIAKKLLLENDIKLTWQNADSKAEKN